MQNQVLNGGILAWNNQKYHNHYFVTAQQQNDKNTGTSLLQIFSYDVMENKPNIKGQTSCSVSFSCLTWTTYTGTNNQYPKGLIIGGLEDGSAIFIDPEQVIFETKNGNEEVGQGVLRVEPGLYDIAVNSIDYNPFKPNLIALGGNEVLIVNIEKGLDLLDIFYPGSPNKHEDSPITSVAWNQKVPSILASSSQNGLSVVWNLKTNKPIFDFGEIMEDVVKRPMLAWNPEIPTQLAVTFQDEKTNEVQIWDMRNPNGPVILLDNGHSGRIEAISWCSVDPSLILTGGDDKKIVCWNYKTNEKIYEEDLSEQIQLVKWSSIPSLFGMSLTNFQVQIQSLSSDNLGLLPPKWYTPPVGCASIGQLASFHEDSGLVVKLRDVKDEIPKKLVDKINFLNQILDQKEDIQNICELQSNQNHQNQYEKDFWHFLKALSYQDPQEIFSALGFSKKEIIKLAENYTGKTHEKNTQSQAKESKKPNKSMQFSKITETQAEDFFDNMDTQIEQKKEPMSNSNSNVRSGKIKNQSEEQLAYEQVSKNINWDAGIEKIIKENIIIGNYEGAIDCSLKCGRTAEALLIAYSHSKELFENTFNSYFVSSTDNFIKNVFKNLIKKNNEGIIEHYDLDKWKECAGLLLSQCNSLDVFYDQMDDLAERILNDKKNQEQAILCLVLSKNFNKVTQLFYNSIASIKNNKGRKIEKSIDLLSKLIIFNKVTGGQEKSKFYDRMLYDLSQYFYDNGQIETCYKLLLQANRSIRIASFMDQIYQTFYDKLVKLFPQAPAYPLKSENIKFQVYRQQQQQQQRVRQVQGQKIQDDKNLKDKKPIQPIFDPSRVENVTNIQQQIPDKMQVQQQPKQFNPHQKIQAIPTPKPLFNPVFNKQQNPLLSHNQSTVNQPPPPGSHQPPIYNPPKQTKMPFNSSLTNLEKKPSQDQSAPTNFFNPNKINNNQETLPPPPKSNPGQRQNINNTPSQNIYKMDQKQIDYVEQTIELHIMGLQMYEQNQKKSIELIDQLRNLYIKMQNSELTQNCCDQLVKICQHIENEEWPQAVQVHQVISKNDWEKNKGWLVPLKRLLVKR